jgi:hypothetical protein
MMIVARTGHTWRDDGFARGEQPECCARRLGYIPRDIARMEIPMPKLIALAPLLLAAPVAAQDMPMAKAAAPVCPHDAEPVPAALSGWSVKAPLAAAADVATLHGAAVAVGKAYTLALGGTAAVRYAAPPAHVGAPGSHGGMVWVAVREAGTYRVAIGAGAWVDVVAGSAALPSISHGHGPACSGIRKMVDFALRPGGYAVQIAGNAEATIPLLIAKVG